MLLSCSIRAWWLINTGAILFWMATVTCSKAVYSDKVKRPGLSMIALCNPSAEYISRLKYRRAFSKCLAALLLLAPSSVASVGRKSVNM